MGFFRRITQLTGTALLWYGMSGTVVAGDLTIFAAASLKEALDEVARDFSAETGHSVTVSYAGSSTLARQIALGAPADLFLSASPEWMDQVQNTGHIDAASRFDLLGNRLVLIAGTKSALGPVTLEAGLDLPALLDGGRLAMALTEAVPAGIYGKAALTSLGLWESVAPSVAETDNVRAALALVALEAAPLGIVYATDVRAEPRVKTVGNFPAESHPEITFPAAATAAARQPQTDAFLDYLRRDAAHDVFRANGFRIRAE
jgi:molybdate transport system substrate-binding protein